jgi:hypothetical protein
MLRSMHIAASLLLVIGVASAREALPFGGTKKADADDRGHIVERLRGKYQDVLDRLNKNEPGADTLAMQKEIAELLQRLLEQDEPPSAQAPPPVAKDAPKHRSDPASNPAQKPAPQSAEKAATQRPNVQGLANEPSAKSLGEMKKQLQAEGNWPLKLPPRHRDYIEVSGGGRFMPRYEELLRAYYRRIAESHRGTRDE